jgi:hypothetical protein
MYWRRCMATMLSGVGDKMEDWVEQLHPTGMHLRKRFRTVQNPVIHALVREKANSRLSHPDMIAHTSATNAGNKHTFSVMTQFRQDKKGSVIWGNMRQ